MMNVADISGFCDLNIIHNPDERLLERIHEFGYRSIALNWTVNVSETETDSNKGGKRKKGGNKENFGVDVFPDKVNQSFKNVMTKKRENLRVFLRITVVFSKPDQLKIVLNSPQIKQYDIISVVPTCSAAYEHACTNPLIDLISFEVGISNFKPNGKMHRILVNRSAYFEICYSQALKSSVKRQELFTMTQYFGIYGKLKNAIISSGASHYLELRNPYDVANLGLLFGFSNDMAKKALTHNCKMLLVISAGRRYGKTAITVELIEECEEPNRKRAKLQSKDQLSEVADHMSSLTTAESICG